MKRDELSPIQVEILLMVLDEGGRIPTESLYDYVEEERPTLDENGEELEGMEMYETSREEIGTLEGADLLAVDENTCWAGGASVFTDAGRRMAEEIARDRE